MTGNTRSSPGVIFIGTASHGRSGRSELAAVAHNLSGVAETFADRRHAGVLFRQTGLHVLGAHHRDTLATREEIAYWSQCRRK